MEVATASAVSAAADAAAAATAAAAAAAEEAFCSAATIHGHHFRKVWLVTLILKSKKIIR